MSEFLRREIAGKTLSPGTAIGLHKLLYQSGAVIQTRGRNGNMVAIPPGAWRQRELTPTTSHPWMGPWYFSCSSPANIEADLCQIIAAFNKIIHPRREDILRFYFEFMRVHPFADANGRTAALLADALCARHGLQPLTMLAYRFVGGKFFFHQIFGRFESDPSDSGLASILQEIDAFNQGSG